MAINSEDRDGRPACHQIGFCMSGCAIGAKWSTLYTEIPKAETTGRFELRPESMAVKINHDDAGKVTGVDLRRQDGRDARAKGTCRLCRRQLGRNTAVAAQFRLRRNFRKDSPTPLDKSAATTCGTRPPRSTPSCRVG